MYGFAYAGGPHSGPGPGRCDEEIPAHRGCGRRFGRCTYRVYPWDTGPFFRVGFGSGFASAVLPTPEGELKYVDHGFAALGSLGWDAALTNRVYVGPVVDVFYIDAGDDVSSLLVTLSVGVSWR